MSKIHKALQKAELEEQGFAWVPSAAPSDHAPSPLETVVPRIFGERVFDDSTFPRVAFTPAARACVETQPAASEDFNRLHNRLELQPAGARTRSLLITSALPGEGSSIVTLALGASIARKTNRSVLLVDGDFRNPNLDRFFGGEEAPGLMEVLGSGLPVEETIRATEQERLYCLPAGRRNGGPGALEVIQDPSRLRNLGSFLKQQFNYVLLDSSPVLANSDVQILAPAVDGVILVVQAHKTRGRVAQEAKKLLERSGGQLLGVVLNRRRFPLPSWLYRRV